MKRLLMILLATLTLQGAMAQINNNRSWRTNQTPMSAKEHAAYWAKELNLTAGQRQQIERLNQQYADLFRRPQGIGAPLPEKPKGPQQKNWRTNTPAPAPSQKPNGKGKPGKEFEKQWKEYKKSLRKILTNKQYKEYEKLTKQPHMK